MNNLVILFVSLVLLALLGAGCGEEWAESGGDDSTTPDTSWIEAQRQADQNQQMADQAQQMASQQAANDAAQAAVNAQLAAQAMNQ